ncbi:uncharacterized protein B0P05DRAFT_535075 [Gilbertella persicaria]|uniref:uncharacterized protein n=1 Tax=Gilbertella persicaria TaxID=101096 RepID=UPI0022207173|nr:uncharacterized protein B0P05DRAFT_535075 [Gilbertella persicaria]KAI8084317.1 hypothetical protein B0P05DRAFT_535075 [Gilbertella persicaria]
MWVQESDAWITYSVLFGLMTILLFIKATRKQWHIFPFIVYAAFMTFGHLYVALTPYFTREDIGWKDQEPILNQMPAFSILVFGGIIEFQFIYARFIVAALRNYRRWGSLHPVVIDEKSEEEDTTSEDSHEKLRETAITSESYMILSQPPPVAFSISSMMLWINISILVLYAATVVVFLSCKSVLEDEETVNLASALCMTVMTVPTVLNFLTVLYISGKCRSSEEIRRIIRQNRQDALILFLMPLLFMWVMSNTTAVAWLAVKSPLSRPFMTDSFDLKNWIVFKSFLIYFPLVLLLICCAVKSASDVNLLEENRQVNPSSERTVSSNTTLMNRIHSEERMNKRLMFI